MESHGLVFGYVVYSFKFVPTVESTGQVAVALQRTSQVDFREIYGITFGRYKFYLKLSRGPKKEKCPSQLAGLLRGVAN